MATNKTGKYKPDPSSAFSHLADLPDNLDGVLFDIQGKEVTKSIEDSKTEAKEGEASQVDGTAAFQQAESTEKASQQETAPKKAKREKTTKERKDSTPKPPVEITLKGGDLWEQFVNLCEDDKQIGKELGYNGSAKLMRIENDIVETFRRCRVNDNTITTMVNAVLRAFLLHYKQKFLEFKTAGTASIF